MPRTLFLRKRARGRKITKTKSAWRWVIMAIVRFVLGSPQRVVDVPEEILKTLLEY